MKKPTPAERSRAQIDGVADQSFAKKYPTLVEYLITEAWDDGTSREPSSLAITLKDGMMQLALNDKALKQSLYTAAAGLPEALGLMEKCLKEGTGSWRPWKTGKGK